MTYYVPSRALEGERRAEAGPALLLCRQGCASWKLAPRGGGMPGVRKLKACATGRGRRESASYKLALRGEGVVRQEPSLPS